MDTVTMRPACNASDEPGQGSEYTSKPRGRRAVSSVIGVILLVAIVVVLAAVIGTFVLNLGGSVSKSVQAGASATFEKGASGDGEVRVTYVEQGNSEKLEVNYTVDTNPGSNDITWTGDKVLEEPGDTLTLSEDGGNADETIEVTITVTAFLESDEKAVVLEKSGEI